MDALSPPDTPEFAALVAALPSATAVFAADAPHFTVLAASDALLEAAQRPRDAVVGHPLAEAFPDSTPADPQASGFAQLCESLTAALRTGVPQHMNRQRYDLPRPDGTWEVRYWDAVNIPVRGADGAVRHVLHQTTDVTAQVRADAAAQMERVEQRAEGILERMSDAHCVLDRDFRIVGVNAAAERLLGRSRDTLLGRSHWEAFPASVDAPVGHAFRRVVAEGIEQHLTHHYTGEGYDFHLEVDAYPTDEGGLAMFWRDVTERVRAEETLRKSEAKFYTLFESMRQGYALNELVRDADGRAVDYRFLEFNPAAERLMRRARDQVVGRLRNEVFAPDPVALARYASVVESQQPERFELYAPPTGAWYDLSVFPRGGDTFAVLFDDISERKAAEAALRASEARQAFLLRISDALRAETEPVLAQTAALQHLVEHLGLVRAAFYEVADDQNAMRRIAHVGATAAAWPQQLRMSDFGPDLSDTYRAGRIHAVSDVETDSRLSEEGRAAIRALGVRSLLGIPLVRGGKLQIVMGVHALERRAWRDDELELLHEVADRCWAAVERACAEAALRESEAKYRSLFETMGQGYALCEMVRDDMGRAVDIRLLDMNPAYERLMEMRAEDSRGRAHGSSTRSWIAGGWSSTTASCALGGTSGSSIGRASPTSGWRPGSIRAGVTGSTSSSRT